jgi:hypothetical protein
MNPARKQSLGPGGRRGRSRKGTQANGASAVIEYSPRAIKNIKRKREREEREWAARSGPVTVTRMEA